MSEGSSFHGSPRTGGRLERPATALVIVALIAFVGIAIAKPWSSPVEPTPSSRLQGTNPTPPAASPEATAREVPNAGPPASVGPLPVAFTTSLPPVSGTWTGLTWRRLAPDDPLRLVTAVVPWRRGFVAVGWVAGPPSTPVWTSEDGTHWNPLEVGVADTFWKGLAVLGVTELRTGLVALTETVQYCGEPCPPAYELPVVSWTSQDGRKWTPHLLPPEWLAKPPGRPPLFSVGPAGMIVASTGPAARLATSTDGSHWRLVPAGEFPAQFSLTDLRGTATGYVAIGRWTTADGTRPTAALRSTDGRQWSEVPTILPTTTGTTTTGAGTDAGAAPASLVVGSDGVVAVGHRGTAPGVTSWWRSADGRRWAALPTYAPLGPTACHGSGCDGQPNGTLVGDGHRMVAIRSGADAAAWTSSDGSAWSRLRAAGDLPPDQATQAVLLPGGVLLTDGTTTWFGEAQGP